MAASLMLQGTGSDVGKSLMVAGLARAYSNRGLKVLPFKPQNMSNNSAIAANGGEIGRAQHLQAIACRAKPAVQMNPVLLKPQSEVGAQVVVLGQVRTNADARAYQEMKGDLLPEVVNSFNELAGRADLVLIEGAGSPAEVNLPGMDIANMGFAAAVNAPVALIADIDRGGVIANLIGTYELLAPADRARIKGYLINKFRGDKSLFDGGLGLISKHTGWAPLGVVGYFTKANQLPAEDAMALMRPAADPKGTIKIAVPKLSRIANFDDIDPLRLEPDVAVNFVEPGTAIPKDADLIIIPGSKATIADMAFLRAQGWDIDILAHHRQGGAILGICGGYQMLGQKIHDPDGIEGNNREIAGLGLLDVDTELASRKELGETQGLDITSGKVVFGYEIHLGQSIGPACNRPMLKLSGKDDGARSADGRVMGCYLHGLFRSDEFRHAFLSELQERPQSTVLYDRVVDQTLDLLAQHLETELPLDRMLEIAQGRKTPRW